VKTKQHVLFGNYPKITFNLCNAELFETGLLLKRIKGAVLWFQMSKRPLLVYINSSVKLLVFLMVL